MSHENSPNAIRLCTLNKVEFFHICITFYVYKTTYTLTKNNCDCFSLYLIFLSFCLLKLLL